MKYPSIPLPNIHGYILYQVIYIEKYIVALSITHFNEDKSNTEYIFIKFKGM